MARLGWLLRWSKNGQFRMVSTVVKKLQFRMVKTVAKKGKFLGVYCAGYKEPV